MRTWLVTGGAGFIGAHLVLEARRGGRARVVNLDALTYAGDRARLAALDGDRDHVFVEGDVADRALVRRLLEEHRPQAVLHAAAETHVDRSIDDPAPFFRSNVLGTLALLDEVKAWWTGLPAPEKTAFRFLHVGTDEVFGSLGPTGAFTEASPHAPRSPYAASKAGADHFVRAWGVTYGLPTLQTWCGNNYGPWQYPEKLVPLVVGKALRGEPVPVYGDGLQVRAWIHVEDHVAALLTVLERGAPAAAYVVGGGREATNLEVVRALCAALDVLRPAGSPHARHVVHVPDRPGHDRRYALDGRRLESELGYRPRHALEPGLEATVRWILAHEPWYARIRGSAYGGERLGLGSAR